MRPSSATFALPLLLAVVVVVVAGALTDRKHPRELRDPSEVAQLLVPPTSLDLGTVWEAEEFAWTVSVENREEVPLEVQSVRATCSCLSVEPQSFVLEPGGRRDLRLNLDLISKTSQTGEVSVQFTLLLNAESSWGRQHGPEWTVKGKVRRALALAPSTYLGRFSELSQPLPALFIPLEILAPVGSVAAVCNRPGFTASVDLPPAEGKAMLRLAPPPDLPVGPFEGTVTLKPVLKTGEPLPERHIRYSGAVVSDLQAEPTVVQVGGRRLGEAFEETVTVRSLTGRPVVTVKAEAEGEGPSVEAVGDRQFRVRQVVCGSGAQTNRVRFTAEVNGRKTAAMLPVSYTGVRPN
jgi:hypothetical protein